MTVKEKRYALDRHCAEHMGNCTECILRTEPDASVGGCYTDVSDEIIEKHYEMVFGPDPDEASYQLKDDISTIREEHERQTDPIKPEYYNDTKITPFDVIDDWGLNFYLGNAVKYIKRAGKKAGNSRLQDLKKIREYIDHEIRAEEVN